MLKFSTKTIVASLFLSLGPVGFAGAADLDLPNAPHTDGHFSQTVRTHGVTPLNSGEPLPYCYGNIDSYRSQAQEICQSRSRRRWTCDLSWRVGLNGQTFQWNVRFVVPSGCAGVAAWTTADGSYGNASVVCS